MVWCVSGGVCRGGGGWLLADGYTDGWFPKAGKKRRRLPPGIAPGADSPCCGPGRQLPSSGVEVDFYLAGDLAKTANSAKKKHQF